MKRVLAIILTIVLLAAMSSLTAFAYTVPDELTAAGAAEIGIWPMDAGMYDPMLDGQGIKDGTRVYSCYEFDFMTFAITPGTVPSSVSGYTKVSSPADMTDGTYCELTFNSGVDYSYILIYGEPGAAAPAEEPAAEVPAEEPAEAPAEEPVEEPAEEPVAEAPAASSGEYPPELANEVPTGVWPMDAGMYDPMLDGQGIQNGTVIFGLYDFDFMTFAITPRDVPATVTGYTKVATPAEMTDGTYCQLDIAGDPAYSYILVMGGAVAAAGGGTPAAPADSAPQAAAPAPAPTGDIPGFSGVVADAAYFSVSVDGALHVAAYPITVTPGMTVQQFLMAAHDELFPGGAAAGFADGLDPMWNMYMINTCWGVVATPYTIYNDQPMQTTADITPIYAGDNLVISTSSDPNVPARAVSMVAEFEGNNATITVKEWVLDFTTFAYTSTPLANTEIIDPITGASLGTTGSDGKVTVPAVGAAAVPGLSVVPVDIGMTGIEKVEVEIPLIEKSTWNFLIRMFIVIIPVFAAVFINMANRRKEYKHLDPLYKKVKKSSVDQNQMF